MSTECSWPPSEAPPVPTGRTVVRRRARPRHAGRSGPARRAAATRRASTCDAGAGFDVGNVSAWLAAQLDDLALPLRWTKLAGGHSNVTYRVDDQSGRTFVVRRPPLGELQPTAHDMGREFRVIDALWPTSVPVPGTDRLLRRPRGDRRPLLRDGVGRGTFAVHRRSMSRSTSPWRPALGTGPSFIDTLAELHALDPDEIGLGSFGKRDSYVGRQLHRWYASWNASKDRELPDVDRLHDVPRRATPGADDGEPRAR